MPVSLISIILIVGFSPTGEVMVLAGLIPPNVGFKKFTMDVIMMADISTTPPPSTLIAIIFVKGFFIMTIFVVAVVIDGIVVAIVVVSFTTTSSAIEVIMDFFEIVESLTTSTCAATFWMEGIIVACIKGTTASSLKNMMIAQCIKSALGATYFSIS